MRCTLLVIIDVTHWEKDEHNAIFPVGARDKEMIWSPSDASEEIKPHWPHLFKESIARYPDQYWTELVAYIVSKYLGVDVPKVYPAIKHTQEGIVCGSLIEWFYDVNTERHIPAGSYFKKRIPDFDDKTGKEHNFIDMDALIRSFSQYAALSTPRLQWLSDMALFDALIGNTDRHQENWGIIFLPDCTCCLSPLFDNGTSLGHERFTENVRDWDKHRLTDYVMRGKHHSRFKREEPKKRIPHFEFLKILASKNTATKTHIQKKIDNLDFDAMIVEIADLIQIKTKIPFTQARFEWIKKNIELRFELIQQHLRHDND